MGGAKPLASLDGCRKSLPRYGSDLQSTGSRLPQLQPGAESTPSRWKPQPRNKIQHLLLRRFKVRKRKRVATATFAGSGCQCLLLAGALQHRPSVCPSVETAPTSSIPLDRSELTRTHPPGRAPNTACPSVRPSIHPSICSNHSKLDPTPPIHPSVWSGQDRATQAVPEPLSLHPGGSRAHLQPGWKTQLFPL